MTAPHPVDKPRTNEYPRERAEPNRLRDETCALIVAQAYTFRIKGHLDRGWSDWFDGLTLTHHVDGTTVLAGVVSDQAALHGILTKIRDLGIVLISVLPLEAE